MKGKYFLSEILTDDSRFKPHCINMITGNVGCGKSEFALNVLPKYAQSNYCILYLTDTNMNKDQIITHKNNTTEYDKEWRKLINSHTKVQIVNQGIRNENIVGWGTFEKAHVAITTMTYAKVGAILYYGHPFDWSKFDFIICDELDNLISFRNIKPQKGKPNILQFTVDKIRDTLLRYPDVRIIGMTATPYKVYQEFKGNTYDVLTTYEIADLIKYEIKDIWHYKDYGKVLQSIPQGKRGIVYFDRIETMKIAETILIKRGHKTASFWSLKSEKKMTQKQISVRKYIIDNQMIPPDVDILLFNATCKTGVNIRNKDITFMVIHVPMLHLKHSDTGYDIPSDTLQQVRGRVRNDLKTVYYHERDDIDYPNPVPVEYLNRKLTTDETEELCGEIRYMKPDKCNEYYKWGEVRKYLEQHGYETTKTTIGHGGKTRGWSIKKL